jgi:hypothetical protein
VFLLALEGDLPARIMRSAQEIFRPYFCLIGHSSLGAWSRFALFGQLSSGEAPLTGSGAAVTVTDAVGVRRHVPSDGIPFFPVRQASDVSRHHLTLR